MIRDTAREIGEEIILPNRARWDEEEIYPHEALKALAEADMMGVYIGEEYGGYGWRGAGSLHRGRGTEPLLRWRCGLFCGQRAWGFSDYFAWHGGA